MNPEERELLEALHALAANRPAQAPIRVEERLVMEFRNHLRLRRAKAWFSAISVGAVAAAIAVLVWIGPRNANPVVQQPQRPVAEESSADFYPMPDSEALPPVESGFVVRVQMPLASLELIGYPVDQDGAADPVDAEVLLGQDGLARGVRLVE
jgi:hypothetical protein